MKAGKDEKKNAYYLRSNAYIQLGEPKKAEADAILISDQGMIRKARDLADHINKVEQKLAIEEFDAAISSLDTIISVSPGATKYKLIRANLAWNKGDFGKFLELSNDIEGLYPNDGSLHYRIGVAKMCENDLQNAQAIIKKTQRIKGSPSNCSSVISAIEGIRKESALLEKNI